MRALICFISLFISTFTFAQSNQFKSIEVEGNLGGHNSKDQFGISYALEGRYNLSDNISVGIGLAPVALIDKGAIDTSGEEVVVEGGYQVKAYVLTGDYYHNLRKIRMFAGLAIGLNNVRYAESDDEEYTDLGNKMGISPRVGVELGWFRPSIKYNYLPKIDGKNLSNIGFTLGIVIGGGRK